MYASKYIQIYVCIQIYPNMFPNMYIQIYVYIQIYPKMIPNIWNLFDQASFPFPTRHILTFPSQRLNSIFVSRKSQFFLLLYFCISYVRHFVFLYFLCLTFCISVFPMFDISLADSKFNFRSPEIVKVL